MALTLSEFIQIVKRQARIGDVGVTSDQVTTDIIRYLNMRRRRFWRRWPWDWSLEDISISITAADVAAGTTDYTLGANVGDIWILDAGGDAPLTPVTLKRYYTWIKRSNQAPSELKHYVKIGRNSSGNLKLRLWPTPASAQTVTGFGKKRLTNYAVADIATNTGIEYFPEDVLDILKLGVESDVAEGKGEKEVAVLKDSQFESMMNKLVPEDENQSDEEVTSPPPAYYVRKKRARGGTTVV